MGSAKNEYFRDPHVTSVVKGRDPVYSESADGIAARILSLGENEFMVLNRSIIPEGFRDSKHFLINSRPLAINFPNSLEEAINSTPALARETVLGNLSDPYHPGYGFAPFAGNADMRQRVVRLVELCEAVRLVSYGMQTGDDITIGKTYGSQR
jgi:hypothetical protein